jgi:hypothetical protein
MAIAWLCILASTSMAMPLSDSIPMPLNIVGSSSCRPPHNVIYNIEFDSVLGGHWNLTGHRHLNRNGTYTDSFRGTVWDTSIQAAFNANNFDWISDSYFVCMHADLTCTSFSMTISDGSVTGFAVYAPF